MEDGHRKNVLDRVNPAKREAMRKIILGAAFAAPAIASFSLDGLTLSKAYGQVANQS
jgi:hypothetical protein